MRRGEGEVLTPRRFAATAHEGPANRVERLFGEVLAQVRASYMREMRPG